MKPRSKLRVCDATVEVLHETGNQAIMCGDVTLLHLVATKMGWEHDAWNTEKRVLDALTGCPGRVLVATKTRNGAGRLVRIFRMPTLVDKVRNVINNSCDMERLEYEQ